MADFPYCIVCQRVQLVTELQMDRRVCDDCASKTGNIVMPPPARRRRTPCGRCGYPLLIRVIPRELSVTIGIDENRAAYGPMFAAYEFKTGPKNPNTINARAGFGVLEAYICRSCGFCDWYCQDPQEIPIGPEYMTEEIDARV